MTVATEHFDWQRSGLNYRAAPYNAMSPNLLQLNAHLIEMYGGQYLGGEGDRDIVGGKTISVHAYGSALDWRYQDPGPGRKFMVDEILRWLIDNSAELGIQQIHDYVGSRIWRAGRTNNVRDAHTRWWQFQPKGSQMGQSWALWLHIETHIDSFGDTRRISHRFLPVPPAPPTPPVPTPPAPVVVPRPQEVTVQFTSRSLHDGHAGNDVRWYQATLNRVASAGLTEDGHFGAKTKTAVANWQRFFGLDVDGVLGPKTQQSIIEISLHAGK